MLKIGDEVIFSPSFLKGKKVLAIIIGLDSHNAYIISYLGMPSISYLGMPSMLAFKEEIVIATQLGRALL
jgi:hypothetical protein